MDNEEWCAIDPLTKKIYIVDSAPQAVKDSFEKWEKFNEEYEKRKAEGKI